MHPRSSTSPHRPLVLTLTLLAAIPFTGCSCEEEEAFLPSGRYEPETDPTGTTLNFGAVSVLSEKRLIITVRSNGRAPLVVDAAATSLQNGRTEAFSYVLSDDLSSLGPGRTSTISVTYRPCPANWEGNFLREGASTEGCPTAPDNVDLVIVDNSADGEAKIIKLFGEPAQPPQIELVCLPSQACNDNPDLSNQTGCPSISFRERSADDPPCDFSLEIRNTKRGGLATGDLVIEKSEILVKNIDDSTLYDGKLVGFTLRDENGNELEITPERPLVISIPAGANFGVAKLRARFEPLRSGTYRGEASQGTGLRLFNNVPERAPVFTLNLSGSGATPSIAARPPAIDFGAVPQGQTATEETCIANFGNSPLTVGDARVRDNTPAFALRFDDAGFPAVAKTINPGETCGLRIFVDYTPTGGQDIDAILVGSNDRASNPLEIPVRGGAIPKLVLDPADQVVFPIPSPLPPPPLPPRIEYLTIRNEGTATLEINELSLEGGETSIDDFTIEGCSAFPCAPAISLCAPSAPGCATSERRLAITYQNNDASQVDQLNLVVTSNDPASPQSIVILYAADVPCLYPSPVITVITQDKRAGQEVCMSALSSDPGGPPGGTTTIDLYEWGQTFGPEAITFNPPDTVQTCFTPSQAGSYRVSLRVRNSCGAFSQGARTELINVAPN